MLHIANIKQMHNTIDREKQGGGRGTGVQNAFSISQGEYECHVLTSAESFQVLKVDKQNGILRN